MESEVKWFFIAIGCIAFSVSLMIASNAYNATKAGLEECPKFGAGSSGDSIWVKSCREYTELIVNGEK